MKHFAHPLGCIIRSNAAVFHNDHPIGSVVNILQPMLRNDDGSAQFKIDFTQHIQKIRCRNGVQLAGGLVQNQHIRLHCHNRSEVYKLLLTAGQQAHIPIKPVLNTEEIGHFRNTKPHNSGIRAQIFKPEGQFVPDFVRNDLVIRILHHEAYF